MAPPAAAFISGTLSAFYLYAVALDLAKWPVFVRPGLS
jgi:hypothetical protein